MIWAGRGRKKETLDAFWAGLSEEERTRIEGIAMDMHEPYIQSTLRFVPGAADKIVFDKFHITMHLTRAVDLTRRLIMREGGHSRLRRERPSRSSSTPRACHRRATRRGRDRGAAAIAAPRSPRLRKRRRCSSVETRAYPTRRGDAFSAASASSARAKRVPRALFEAAFGRFGAVDGFVAIFDAGTTERPWRPTRAASRASFPDACAASSPSSGIPRTAAGRPLVAGRLALEATIAL